MKVVCNQKSLITEMRQNVWYFVTRRNGSGDGEVQSAYRPGFRVSSCDDPVLYLEPDGTISYSPYSYFLSEYEIVGEAEHIVVS